MESITLIHDSENNVFCNVSVFAEKGYACLVGNDLGGKSNSVPQGTCFEPPFTVDSLDAHSSIKSIVTGYTGATLSITQLEVDR